MDGEAAGRRPLSFLFTAGPETRIETRTDPGLSPFRLPAAASLPAGGLALPAAGLGPLHRFLSVFGGGRAFRHPGLNQYRLTHVIRELIREVPLEKPSLTPDVAKDKATECFELAARADHVAHRLIIENMAKTWERIAEVLEDARKSSQ